jgi:hypothetical protein
VSVANSDKGGVDFLVFERPGKCTITGVVEGNEEWRPHVMVCNFLHRFFLLDCAIWWYFEFLRSLLFERPG